MVDYMDIPLDTIVICPHCGAKNTRTDILCNNCERSLEEAKEALAIKKQTWSGSDIGTQPGTITMADLKSHAKQLRDSQTCGVCVQKIRSWASEDSSYPCSFCGAPICKSCMRSRKFEVKENLLPHMERFGLEPFSGVKNQYELFFPRYVPGDLSYTIDPGYYLCSDCIQFMNGPGFFDYAKDYYERTGRYEELAELYEFRGQLDEAKRVRLQARAPASAQLSELMKKLREDGLAIPYKCPSCGANITVDSRSTADGLRFCSYCGTAVNTEALVKALEAGLR